MCGHEMTAHRNPESVFRSLSLSVPRLESKGRGMRDAERAQRGDAIELERVAVTRKHIAHNSPPARAEQSSSSSFLFFGIRFRGGFGFSWHGVVVRLDAMLFDVSLPPITILHLSAPSARLVLRVRLG